MPQDLKEYTGWYHSPLGWIEITVNDPGVCKLFFRDAEGCSSDKHLLLDEAIGQLGEYFSGKLTSFTLPLSPAGTDFQKKVWKELLTIPFGNVITYRDLGIRLGGNNFTRIVGQANGRNLVSIIIPCHRVIGMNGALTGYGGGLWRKKWLLEFEQKTNSGFTSVLF
ncbi:MAG: methylated-DNA--[protein]-cysteine S-methyltransferase [Bacteroidota bacterium]